MLNKFSSIDSIRFAFILQTKFEISMMTIIRIFPLFWIKIIDIANVCLHAALHNLPIQREYDRPIYKNSKYTNQWDT